jgi:hypothetical protein
MCHTFVFVDPTVGGQSLGGFIARGFQKFCAFLRPRLLVIASTRRGSNHGQHDHAEEREKKHDSEPRG